MGIYKEVLRQARNSRDKAVAAYLEVKRIKLLYKLDVDDSDDVGDLELITE